MSVPGQEGIAILRGGGGGGGKNKNFQNFDLVERSHLEIPDKLLPEIVRHFSYILCDVDTILGPTVANHPNVLSMHPNVCYLFHDVTF